MTLLWTTAVYLWLKDRTRLAGVSLALICVFKPMLAIFLVWGVLRREWKFVGGFVTSLLAIQALTIAICGWRNELDYFAVLSYLSHRGEALIANQTVNGLLQRLLRNGSLSWSDTQYPPFNRTVYLGTSISSLLMLSFGLVIPIIGKWKNRTQDFIMFGLISTISSPIAWEHHYGYFFIGYIYFLAWNLSKPLTKRFYLFTASFVVMANSLRFLEPLAATRYSVLLSYDLYAGLILIMLLAYGSAERHLNCLGKERLPHTSIMPSADEARVGQPAY